MAISPTALLSSLGAGCAVCAAAYVLLGPDRLFRKRGRCPGLANLGNTCFLNAVLQALASLPALCAWLKSSAEKNQGRRLATAISHTLSVLGEGEGGGGEVHSPSAVLQALIWHRWAVDFKQQDAHELYHVLLTTLEEEALVFSEVQGKGLGQLLQEPSPPPAVGRRGHCAWGKTGHVSVPPSPPACPLEGLLASELSCCHCGYSFPVRYESFDSLSLSLPSHTGSLLSCLSDFMRTEVVFNVHCPQCSKSAGDGAVVECHRRFTKRLCLARAPACLCVHLQRTVWRLGGGGAHKNNCRLSFPLSLNMGRFSNTQCSRSIRLELCAVVEHMGGPWSGHYTTYRKLSSSSSSWVYTSDAAVYSVTISEVLDAQAYMLFYQRVAATSH